MNPPEVHTSTSCLSKDWISLGVYRFILVVVPEGQSLCYFLLGAFEQFGTLTEGGGECKIWTPPQAPTAEEERDRLRDELTFLSGDLKKLAYDFTDAVRQFLIEMERVTCGADFAIEASGSVREDEIRKFRII